MRAARVGEHTGAAEYALVNRTLSAAKASKCGVCNAALALAAQVHPAHVVGHDQDDMRARDAGCILCNGPLARYLCGKRGQANSQKGQSKFSRAMHKLSGPRFRRVFHSGCAVWKERSRIVILSRCGAVCRELQQHGARKLALGRNVKDCVIANSAFAIQVARQIC